MSNRFDRFRMQYFSSLYDETLASLMPSPRNVEPFIFIMGSGRNGSTLLACILNNHPGICIPPEHSIIPETIRYWHLHPFASWEQKVSHICELLTRPSQWEINLENLRRELLQSREEEKNPNGLLKAIYASFAPLQQKINPVPGDKTPANTVYLKMIRKQFPASRIIFLLRDPRDIMASLLKANQTYYTERFDFMLWRWQNSVDKFLSISSRYPQQILLLKYEDLVNNTEQETNSVIRFTGLEPVHGLLDNYAENLSFLGVKDASHHQNILNPVSTNSIGSWKKSLSPVQAKRIESRLGRTMKVFGY